MVRLGSEMVEINTFEGVEILLKDDDFYNIFLIDWYHQVKIAEILVSKEYHPKCTCLDSTFCLNETAEISMFKRWLLTLTIQDFEKSCHFPFSIVISGHNYLLFQDILHFFSPIPYRLTGCRRCKIVVVRLSPEQVHHPLDITYRSG